MPGRRLKGNIGDQVLTSFCLLLASPAVLQLRPPAVPSRGACVLVAINYRATGLDGVGNWNAAAAKLVSNASECKVSKDEGSNKAHQTLASYADSCRESKFILFGYSQGAHIAGDPPSLAMPHG